MSDVPGRPRTAPDALETIRMVVCAAPLMMLSALWLPWLYWDAFSNIVPVSGWSMLRVVTVEGADDVGSFEATTLQRLVVVSIVVLTLTIAGLTWVHFTVPRLVTAVLLSTAAVLAFTVVAVIAVWDPNALEGTVELGPGIGMWATMVAVIILAVPVRGAIVDAQAPQPYPEDPDD